jgi:ABC-type transport system involved in multi-copper enzyme maturation permease subunit
MMTRLVPTLALLLYSLRLESRALSTYLLRGMLALGILFMLWTTWLQRDTLGAPGRTFFTGVVMLNLIFITMAGIGVFCAAITEEKEEGTLGLLRMTSLSAVTILLGKGTSRLVGCALLLAAQVPFTLLAITLGGVALNQILASYVALGAYLFLLANLGLLASTLAPRTQTASGAVTMLLGGWLIGPWFAAPMLMLAGQSGLISPQAWYVTSATTLLDWLKDASPFLRVTNILWTGFEESVWSFQVVSNVVAGLALFAMAWLALRSSALEPQAVSQGRALTLPVIRSPGRRRKAWTGARALAWKEFHFTSGGWLGLLVRALLLALAAVAIAIFNYRIAGRRIDYEDLAGVLMVVSIWAIGLEAVAVAGQVFNNEIRWKTLTSLSMLPMPMWKIAWSKTAGTLLGPLPAVLMFIVASVAAPRVLGEALHEMLDEPVFWMLAMCGLAILTLTAYFSTMMRWGAPMVALAIVVFGSMFSGMLISGVLNIDGNVYTGLMAMAWALVSALVVLATPAALKAAAAES